MQCARPGPFSHPFFSLISRLVRASCPARRRNEPLGPHVLRQPQLIYVKYEQRKGKDPRTLEDSTAASRIVSLSLSLFPLSASFFGLSESTSAVLKISQDVVHRRWLARPKRHCASHLHIGEMRACVWHRMIHPYAGCSVYVPQSSRRICICIYVGRRVSCLAVYCTIQSCTYAHAAQPECDILHSHSLLRALPWSLSNGP